MSGIFGGGGGGAGGAGGGLTPLGAWNASTNSPSLSDGSGAQGEYYIVSVAGSTSLDGITDWEIGDWLVSNGTIWEKLDQTDLVQSVAGKTGAVTLVEADVSDLGTYLTKVAADALYDPVGASDGTKSLRLIPAADEEYVVDNAGLIINLQTTATRALIEVTSTTEVGGVALKVDTGLGDWTPRARMYESDSIATLGTELVDKTMTIRSPQGPAIFEQIIFDTPLILTTGFYLIWITGTPSIMSWRSNNGAGTNDIDVAMGGNITLKNWYQGATKYTHKINLQISTGAILKTVVNPLDAADNRIQKLTTGERDALATGDLTADETHVIYNETTAQLETWNGSAWVAVKPAAAVTSIVGFLVHEEVLSGADGDLDVSGLDLSSYLWVEVQLNARHDAASSASVGIRFNADSGSNYNCQRTIITNAGAITDSGVDGAGLTRATIGSVGPNNSNAVTPIRLRLTNFGTTFNTLGEYWASSGSTTTLGSLMWLDTSAVTQIQFLDLSDDSQETFEDGSALRIYGYKAQDVLT